MTSCASSSNLMASWRMKHTPKYMLRPADKVNQAGPEDQPFDDSNKPAAEDENPLTDDQLELMARISENLGQPLETDDVAKFEGRQQWTGRWEYIGCNNNKPPQMHLQDMGTQQYVSLKVRWHLQSAAITASKPHPKCHWFFWGIVSGRLLEGGSLTRNKLGHQSCCLLRWFSALVWFVVPYGNHKRITSTWLLVVNGDQSVMWCTFSFGGFMSRQRLEKIRTLLRLTFDNPPAYKDHFWVVWQLIAERNKIMTAKFLLGRVACLNKTIFIWTNKYTCPGFVCVPRKTHLFGSNFHRIYCGVTQHKDKDAPAGHTTEEKGKTTGLL
jgi:Transposase IS4